MRYILLLAFFQGLDSLCPPSYWKRLVFIEDFEGSSINTDRWNDTGTWAYDAFTHNNAFNMLDWITPSALQVANDLLTINAWPSNNKLADGQQAWYTGLITTENSKEGFMVQVGDYLEARFKLPSGQGAWPAVWTWVSKAVKGNAEIDSFEYHPNNANILELTNHVNPAHTDYSNPSQIYPGNWITVGTFYGATNNQGFVNGDMVYQDWTGCGSGWTAYINLNLGVSNGTWNPAPNAGETFNFVVDWLRVYR